MCTLQIEGARLLPSIDTDIVGTGQAPANLSYNKVSKKRFCSLKGTVERSDRPIYGYML